MTGPNEKMIKIEALAFDNFVIKIDEDKFGIMYTGFRFALKKHFLDVHDFLTQKFLYRIRDINGDNINNFIPLKDGTSYFETFNKDNSGIIKIIKDIGYQVLYNIYFEGGFYILHDERIITKTGKLLSLYEKDNEGIYKKIKEKSLDAKLDDFKQLREKVMAGINTNYIYFFDIDSLSVIKQIEYINRRENKFVLLNKKFLLVNNLCLTSNTYNLVDIDSMKLIEYYTKDELYRKRNNMSNFSNLNLKDIVSSCNLPNGRVIILFLLVMHHIYYIYNFYWDEKK